jgi:hypothetical protein
VEIVSQKMKRSCLIRLCTLVLANFRLDNGMIEAHAVEFDLDVGGPRKLVVVVESASCPQIVLMIMTNTS